MSGEQVVPTWGTSSSTSDSKVPIPSGILKPRTKNRSLRRVNTVKSELILLSSSHKQNAAVPVQATKSSPLLPKIISPALEYAGKMRWTTPTRVGNWSEPWHGARELALKHCVRSAQAPAMGEAIRQIIAQAVAAHVGPQLPTVTVEKWLCLLSEYLELNADEQVLVVCQLKRYIECGGKFVGQGDWARPQRWECVVAVACYLSVLLTEEFPGRTAMDLKELLGANFRFGREQISFLKTVNWKVSTRSEEFLIVKETCDALIAGDQKALQIARNWFNIDSALDDMKKRAEKEAAAAAANAAAQAAALATPTPVTLVGKKRSFATIAPATTTDSVVPRVVIPRMDVSHVVPTAFIPTVPHWAHQW